MKRRSFVQASLALGSLGSLAHLSGCASTGRVPEKARVVVIGGGYGGATAAKYVRLLSNYKIDVVMVEPDAAFVSCPISNLVIGGSKTMADITTPYDKLSGNHGVNVVRDYVSRVDPEKKTVILASGPSIRYDKLIMSPGIELMFNSIEGLQAANASGQILHAWKAGPETLALRKQLEAMPDGGVFAISVPEAPYRCPPGPYERASQVAHYFKQHKPKSKVLILDANQDVTSKGPLFKKFWADNYKGILEYVPQQKVIGVDAKNRTLQFEIQNDLKADVLNVLPNMRAGSIAVQTHLANANGRWCGVNFLTFESTQAKDIHIIGDSIMIAPLMPKSGHMANSHGKVAAAAVVAQLSDMAVNPAPFLSNTCYSFVDDKVAVHVASMHQYDSKENTYKTVPGSGGLSPAPSELEGLYALNWAQNIWADSLM
ncbi:NAD(P)/FAD-dependent oxidoreductase [Limnohabitans sp. JirII-31]|uniref:NAD(P)/FAD-dependent oxidoreductase n=1 Tax=Limnohabitans sp. JirII-31 TaxID=1977908 RepID=UPI000C1F90BD|nr:NAD(P)/FAD-dependent oxidoreductase [Limnohabitans sp. JirII-31]PIT79943.1 flavocytochrome C [Limnohabitans sp. JirII-31]